MNLKKISIDCLICYTYSIIGEEYIVSVPDELILKVDQANWNTYKISKTPSIYLQWKSLMLLHLILDENVLRMYFQMACGELGISDINIESTLIQYERTHLLTLRS